jgi:sensor histidine kinase YesM
MKLQNYKKYLLLTLVITIVIVGFYSIQHSFAKILSYKTLITSILFTILVTISIILVNFPIFYSIKIYQSPKKGIIKNILAGFIITSATAAIIISIWVMIFYALVDQYYENEDVKRYGLNYVLFNNIITAIIVNFFVGAFTVIIHLASEWKKTLIETEEQKRVIIESQYAALLSQINPHFLFNSLNALVSLIPESPEKAVEFVNRFSKIYRYVLDSKDKIVCELKDELDFADAYCFLQKIRFGDNLIIEKKIDYQYLGLFLPPLSLQSLIENAIKHNEISKISPLQINIYIRDGFINVENKLTPKVGKSGSTGIGLKNLSDRYLHLCKEKPDFYIENNFYIARLPLIKEEY